MASVRSRAACLVAIAVLAAADAVADAVAAAPVRFRTVERSEGMSSAIASRTTVTIKSLRHWRSIWRRLHSGESPQPRRPRVDFSRHMLILVTMGQEESGGHSVRIRSIAGRESTWLVRADELSPGPSCTTTSVVTSPYHVVRVRRTAKRIVVRRAQSEYDCALYQP